MKVLDLDPRTPRPTSRWEAPTATRANSDWLRRSCARPSRLDPARSNYHSALGALLVSEQKPAEAETELRTAIGLDPKNAQAHFQLAELLAAEPNRQAEANTEYEQARALDPKLVPPATPTPTETAAAAGPTPAPSPKLTPLNKVYLLTRDSPVYQNPDATSAVVAHVRRKKYVNVIGIEGAWLQVKMKDGTVGFVPVSAAE